MFKKLVNWSKKFEDLPWRIKRTPYRTLVSEIMLQQTTVFTVKNHFENFIKEFPDIRTLATHSEEEVLIAWKGLGYYRRAKNLKKAADYIVLNHGGIIPLNYEDLIKIPGIGDYTASAIISIFDNQNVFAIDANLERVLSRLFFLKEEKGKKLNQKIKELEKDPKILKSFKDLTPSSLNEALMDLGRNYCKKSEVFCELCPVSDFCLAHKKGVELSFPYEGEKTISKKYKLKLLRIIVKSKKGLLVYKKKDNEWLHGQNELPTFILHSEDTKLNQYPKINYEITDLPSYKTLITKYKITNYILELSEREFFKLKKGNEYFWCEPSLKTSNLTTASLKALKNRERR